LAPGARFWCQFPCRVSCSFNRNQQEPLLKGSPYACVCVCVCVCVCACVCVCVCMRARTRVCFYTHTHTHTHTHTYVRMYMYVCMYVCMYIYSHLCVCVCTYIHICVCVYKRPPSVSHGGTPETFIFRPPTTGGTPPVNGKGPQACSVSHGGTPETFIFRPLVGHLEHSFFGLTAEK